MFGEIQPAVKKETKKVIIYTLTGIVLMWIVFAVLHGTMPEKVPRRPGRRSSGCSELFSYGTYRTEGCSL